MINGVILRDAVISAANNIANFKQEVDALNVFPVPDGDTGTNMSMTMNAAKRELELLPDSSTVEKVSAVAASALLRGARGNSGVILSLLFRGFSKGLAGKETASATDLVDALNLGVKAAYKAVMKPTEGTILTVARVAGEQALEYISETTCAIEIWEKIIEYATKTLDETPELLPVLKKAGVVDAGGKGLVVIFEGMYRVFKENTIIQTLEGDSHSRHAIDQPIALDNYDEEITFTYCTEFIIDKDEKNGDHLKLRAYLESIGDSVVVVDDDDIIKCHLHTDNPGNAMQEALKLGMLSRIKIDNMREQSKNNKAIANPSTGVSHEYQAVDRNIEYGFVTVSAGEGNKQLFSDLGADNIVTGGQTMNPSTDDILTAIHATPAKNVFVLPNNKNIIMAAEQAVKLADRNVFVLPTRTIPQGFSAMLAFDPDQDIDNNVINMSKAYEKVVTGQITFAARDSEFDGHNIKKGEVLALENSKLAFTENDLSKAVARLLKHLIKKEIHKETVFVTIIFGQDVTEQEVETVLETMDYKLPENVELSIINGGQPIYYYFIAVE